MTEQEAREAILRQGYRITGEWETSVTVMHPGTGRNACRTWTGANFLDLVQTFKLHERPTRRTK